VFGEDSVFFSDFGENFQYKEDVPPSSSGGQTENNSSENDANSIVVSSNSGGSDKLAIKTISYPSMESVLSKKWNEITSRFFPLSPTFVKARALNQFRYSQLIRVLIFDNI